MGQIQSAASGLANSVEGSVKAVLLKKIQQTAEKTQKTIEDKGNVKAKASPYATNSDITPSYTVESDMPETPNFNYDPYTQLSSGDTKYSITPYDQQMAMKAQTRLLSYQTIKGLDSGNYGNYWSIGE